MLRDNVLRIFVFAKTTLIWGEPAHCGEKRLPKLFLQFLNLSLKICDECRLFLGSRRSDKFTLVKTAFAWNL